jgi:hypothetical protein
VAELRKWHAALREKYEALKAENQK